MLPSRGRRRPPPGEDRQRRGGDALQSRGKRDDPDRRRPHHSGRDRSRGGLRRRRSHRRGRPLRRPRLHRRALPRRRGPRLFGRHGRGNARRRRDARTARNDADLPHHRLVLQRDAFQPVRHLPQGRETEHARRGVRRHPHRRRLPLDGDERRTGPALHQESHAGGL